MSKIDELIELLDSVRMEEHPHSDEILMLEKLEQLRPYVELAELVVAGDIIDTKRYRLYINRRMNKLIQLIKEQK